MSAADLSSALASLYGQPTELPSWAAASWFVPPKTFPAGAVENELRPPRGVRGLYLKGPDFAGRETRIFAWVGLPDHRPGEKLPAMVLVHGGRGTAYLQWVRQWTERGYAAIAMDTAGAEPSTHDPQNDARRRHAWAGPEGWGGYAQIGQPESDQWPYHAVAAVIIAHSHLRSLPEVDVARIGLAGISWGGFLTCHVAALDPRFRCAIAVYGCGFYGFSEGIFGNLLAAGRDVAEAWIRKWDPAHRLGQIRIPMLWINGQNDPFFSLRSLADTCRRLIAPHTIAVLDGLGHSHEMGWSPAEIAAYADAQLRNGPPLPAVHAEPNQSDAFAVTWTAPRPVIRRQLFFTTDGGDFRQRKWQSLDLDPGSTDNSVRAAIPAGTTFCYLNLTDDRGLRVSSELRSLA